ncbi:MAG: cytochrome c biogenesis protein DipZ [Solirubrobacteraceae bacterium]
MSIILAALFALLAGFGTAFSPCVLPVLPLALSSAATGGRRRPLGIALGLAASFAFATLALAYVIAALGLPADLLRIVAVVVLLVFGVSLVVPPVAARLEGWLSRLVPQRAASADGEGFGSGLALGASLGLLYVPCAGPILAAVLTIQASQDLSAQRVITGLAYAVGTAVGVLIVLLAGRRLLGRLRANAGRLQQALGVVMVLVAVLTLSGADGQLRNAIANNLPSWLVDPTSKLERSQAATRAFDRKAQKSGLQDAGQAPELTGTQKWFNTPGGRKLTLAGLRGRVVLIDFWTYTCINCIRTQPHLKAWDARYRSDGLTIIGVHSPEFPFERDAGNVERAVKEAGLRYPIAQDNDLAVWNAFQNQYWPAEYLIDARGHVRYAAFGEGDYDKTESAIQGLLRDAGRPDAAQGPSQVKAQTPSPDLSTPETYLGAQRAKGFVGGRVRPGAKDFGALPAPARLPQDAFAYGGRWKITDENATAGAGARLAVHFGARRVFLVLGSPDHARHVQVRLDGKLVKTLRVDGQRLYTLADLPSVQSRNLELRFEAGVQGYAFTFG